MSVTRKVPWETVMGAEEYGQIGEIGILEDCGPPPVPGEAEG